MADPKVFVAEDDQSILSIIHSVLSSQDYDIVTVDNADDVLATILEEKPDVAILDVKLPGTSNGFELCYQIKNHSDIGNLPVMILTATTQQTLESDEEWREKANADDFITKPFQSADLVKRIKTLVEQAWKQKEETRFDL